VSTRTGVDDGLPAYSTEDPLRHTINPQELAANTLESMETDGNGDADEGYEEEGIGGMSYHGPRTQIHYSAEQNWNWDNLERSQRMEAPPGSDAGDEDLFGGENSSTKVANSSVSDLDENRMAEFEEDVGTISGAFGTPPAEDIPLLDVPPQLDEELEQPVAEVMLEDENSKMD